MSPLRPCGPPRYFPFPLPLAPVTCRPPFPCWAICDGGTGGGWTGGAGAAFLGAASSDPDAMFAVPLLHRPTVALGTPAVASCRDSSLASCRMLFQNSGTGGLVFGTSDFGAPLARACEAAEDVAIDPPLMFGGGCFGLLPDPRTCRALRNF